MLRGQGANHQAGEVTKQARPVRLSCAGGGGGGGIQGRQGRQAGEAGQAVMCWGGRVLGRQGCQAGEAGKAVLGGGVPGRRGARPAGHHVLGGGGGGCAYQARLVARFRMLGLRVTNSLPCSEPLLRFASLSIAHGWGWCLAGSSQSGVSNRPSCA